MTESIGDAEQILGGAIQRVRKHPAANCESCPLLLDGEYVPSAGPEKTKLAVCGEAPGAYEAKVGEPFVGESGKLLTKILSAYGINKHEVLRTNAASCRRSDGATPTQAAIQACRPRLVAELKDREVTQVVALGNSAAQSILQTKTGITKLRLGPGRTTSEFPGLEVVTTFHPAAALRQPDYFPSIVSDFGKLRGYYSQWYEPKWQAYEYPAEALAALAELEKLPIEPVTIDIESAIEKDMCLAPETSVLKKDLTWVPIGSLAVGDELIAFDQDRISQMQPAIVTATKRITQPCYRVTTKRTSIVCSVNHMWPVKTCLAAGYTWRPTRFLHDRLGRTNTRNVLAEFYLPWLAFPWEEDTTKDGGWLAGILDGEGCLSGRKAGYGYYLNVSQNDGPVFDRVVEVLQRAGFELQIFHADPNDLSSPKRAQVASKDQMLRMLGVYRPVRLLEKASKIWQGTRRHFVDLIESIEYVGERETVAIETTTKTLIAEGYLTHNSFETPARHTLLCVGLGFQRGRVAIIGETALRFDEVREALTHYLLGRPIKAQNGKFDLKGLYTKLRKFIPEGQALKLATDTLLKSYCVSPETRIIKTDLTWVQASEIKTGDEVIAFTEQFNRGTTLKPSRVLNTKRQKAQCFKITTQITDNYHGHVEPHTIVCSANHIWPVKVHGQGKTVWKTTEQLYQRHLRLHRITPYDLTPIDIQASNVAEIIRSRYDAGESGATLARRANCSIGHIYNLLKKTGQVRTGNSTYGGGRRTQLMHFIDPWEVDNTREGGYIAGFLDGEGSLNNTEGSSWQLSYAQNPGPVRDRIRRHLKDKGIALNNNSAPKDKTCIQDAIAYGYRGALRTLGTFRPERWLAHASDIWQGKRKFNVVDIDDIEPIGEQEVIGIETTEGTFIAEGFLTHNCLDERAGIHDLETLGVEKLGTPFWKSVIDRYRGPKESYAVVPRPVLYKYNAFDVHATDLVDEVLTRQMGNDQKKLHNFLVRASNALQYVELNGIGIDLKYNSELSIQYTASLDLLETRIATAIPSHDKVAERFGWRHGTFNPRSPKQVKEVVKDVFGLRLPMQLNQKREYAETTNAEALMNLLERNLDRPSEEFLRRMLEHRKESKTFSTYVKGIRKRVYRGRVYPTYLLHGTTSGRLSCRNPNLQNWCYSNDTEVLTHRGWKLFKDLTEIDKVAQWHQDGTIDFTVPTKLTKQPYTGKMIHIKSCGTDLLVTPSHRMFSLTRGPGAVDGNLQIEPASTYLRWYKGQNPSRKFIRGGYAKGIRELSGAERLELARAVAIQAEGHYSSAWPNHIKLSLNSERKRAQLRELYSNVKTYIKPDGAPREYVWINETDPEAQWLTWPDKNFKPERILELGAEDLKFFIGEIHKWDGDFTKHATYLQHHDRILSLDVVQAAAMLAGMSTSWYEQSEHRSTVNFHPKVNRNFGYLYTTEEDYNNVVYCAQVPTGALVVRRNKLALVCGNTRGHVVRRQAIPAIPGNVFVEADFKQNEGRVLCWLAQDEFLRKIFNDPTRDLFDELTPPLYGDVSGLNEDAAKELRVRVKAYFYGTGYGRTAFSVALEHNIPVAEAERGMNAFLRTIPATVKWQEQIKQQVLNGQDLITPFGRHRRFWLITNKNKKDVLNNALSFKPQSIASDICLDAFIHLRPDLKGIGYVRNLVHDSILTECPENRVGEVRELMRYHMVEAARRVVGDYVKFGADFSVGYNWGTLEKIP